MIRRLTPAILVATLFAVAFWGLDRWAVNNIDDFGYSLVSRWQPTPDGGYIAQDRPVNTMDDAIASQRVEYMHKNGRFLVHALTQWFCGAVPMSVYAVCNSLVFGLAMLLLCVSGIPPERRKWPELLTVPSLAWLMCATLMSMSLGAVSASLNYLWTTAATLAVLAAYRHLRQRPAPPYLLPVIAIAAAIAGSMQESFSIGVSVALIVDCFVCRRQQNPSTVSLILGYLAGTATVTLSPANFARTAIVGIGPNLAPIKDLATEPVVICAVVAVGIAFIINRRQLADVLRQLRVCIIAAAVATAFACLGAYTGPWQLIMVHVMACVVLIRLLISTRHFGRVALIILPVMALTYLPTHQLRQTLWADQQQVYAQVLSPGNQKIIEISNAVEHYAQARRQPLWFLYGHHVGFNLRALVNDNQRCGNPLLSAFVTRGRDFDRVEAVVPLKPTEIEHICQQPTTNRRAAHPIANDFAAITLPEQYNRDQVTLKVALNKRNRTSHTTLRANQVFHYKEQYYYIFTYNNYADHVTNSEYHINDHIP